MPKKQNPVRAGSTKLLRCESCATTVDCSADDLLGYARRGWPKCCGDVMTLFTEARTPDADDTRPNATPLPPGTSP